MLTTTEQTQVKKWLQAELDGEQFPVDFDVAWVMAGYAMKHHAKRRLTNQSSFLVKGEDYMIDKCSVPITQSGESTILGRSSDRIVMTCDAFKHFCLMAQTQKGREIRQYFIEVEKAFNAGNYSDELPSRDMLKREVEWLRDELAKSYAEKYNLDNEPKKFRVHYLETDTHYVYTLVCVIGDRRYVELMSHSIPTVINDAFKQPLMTQFYALVDLLNAMSRDYQPSLKGTVYSYR
jgi:phage anti-repressor protein